MKASILLIFSISLGLFLSAGVVSDAEAKRLGGGKSFGNKMFQQKPAKRTSSKPSKAQQQNADKKASLAKKGGMMGLLGGLMIGGILGALFFGGAFENINFMDILIFGLIAFLLFKLFASRRPQQSMATDGGPVNVPDDQVQMREASNNYSAEDATFNNDEPENILKTGKIPRGFDQKSFLSGAENVYVLLQKAWDSGELGDLRQFSTDHVFAELQDQIRTRTNHSKTEIVSLQSELINVEISGNSTEATVVFNAELREYDDGENPDKLSSVQEAWYFVRPNNRDEHNWLLDSIQQIED